MSNFELQYSGLGGIRSRVQRAGTELSDCAYKLRRQVDALSRQSGFGIESARSKIGLSAASVSTLSGNAFNIASVLSDVDRIVTETESRAYSTLAGTEPKDIDLADGESGNVFPGAPFFNPGYSPIPSWIAFIKDLITFGPLFPFIYPLIQPTWVDKILGDYSVSKSILGWGAAYEDGDVYAGVNAYVGKAEAEWKSTFSLFSAKEKSEYNKETGKFEDKESFSVVNAEIGGSVAVSALSGDAKVKAGDDMLGSEVEGEAAIGKAELEGKGKFNIGEEGVDAYVEGEAKVTAAEGEIKGTINILGLEITGKLEGYAGSLGVEGAAGFRDNKFVLEGGAAALLGFGAGIEIGFNDTGWKNVTDGIKSGFDNVCRWIGNFGRW